jgi:hypothetical protein
VALLATVVWSGRAFFDYGELFTLLAGQPQVERGRIGSNMWQNFLARVGRPGQQRVYERLRRALSEARSAGRPSLSASFDGRVATVGSEREAPSEVADVWAWTRQTADQLGADARIYLNVPSATLYYYANFMWYPRPVRVAPGSAPITDRKTLTRAWERVSAADAPRLRQAGFTHVLEQARSGYYLIDLRRAPPAATP